MKKTFKRLNKSCSICGKRVKLVLYQNGHYRGGHYFGKIPIYSKNTWRKALKAGTKKVKIRNTILNVLKKDPKPKKYIEYWECPKCYWK